jgi:hypothetical protein
MPTGRPQLDQRGDGDAIQDALLEITGGRRWGGGAPA